MISPDSIQEVRDAAQITEVIQAFVQLKRNGRNFKGLCPFHNEKTPSFIVSPEKNIYKCFGCGKAGDPIKFIMEIEGATYPEAIRSLAKMFGVELEQTKGEQNENYQEKESLFILNAFAQQYYSDVLFETESGKSIGLGYFKQRGFLEATLKNFGLGLAYGGKDALLQASIKDGFLKEKLDDAGLLNQYGQDFFRNRVIFPIQSASGKILGFAGRVLVSEKQAAKYINTRETEIYNKRKVLYGLFQAKLAIRREDRCILVEGYTDVMSLHQNDVLNVVAASGTSLTSEQCQLIKRYTKKVLIIFDGDKAGIKASMRGMDILLSEEINVELISLPEGDDPDSFIQRLGSDGFKKYIEENAQDFLLFKTSILLEKNSTPFQKVQAYKDLASSLAKIPNALTRSVYIKECAEILRVDENLIITETNKFLQSQAKMERLRDSRNEATKRRTESKHKQTNFDSNKDVTHERNLIKLLIQFGHETYKEITIIEFIQEQFEDELLHFDCPLSKTILEEAFILIKQGKLSSTEFFTHHKNEEISNFAISIWTDPYSYSSNWEDKLDNPMQNQKMPHEKETYELILMETIIRLKMRKINKQILQNIKDLENAPIEGEESLIKLMMQTHLIESRNHLAKKLNQIVMR